MKRVVVDASVAVKWFVPEIHSEGAAQLLSAQFLLSAPDLIGPELGNTIWKKVRRGEITPTEAAEILNAFATLEVDIHPSSALLGAALELAVAIDRPVYDCFYLALAIAQNGVMVTADRRFHDSVIDSGLTEHIRWIQDQL
jgi:predicted nucleic acid-binding protein